MVNGPQTTGVSVTLSVQSFHRFFCASREINHLKATQQAVDRGL
jgi:hypothetical protein